MPASDLYDRSIVYFGRGRQAVRISCGSRAQAELLAKLVALGLRGSLRLPTSEQACHASTERLEARLNGVRTVFGALAESRSGNDTTRNEVANLLMHWFIHGRGKENKKSRGRSRTDILNPTAA